MDHSVSKKKITDGCWLSHVIIEKETIGTAPFSIFVIPKIIKLESLIDSSLARLMHSVHIY